MPAFTVGVDIGGTKIAAGLVDASGQLLRQLRRPTPAGDRAKLQREVAELVAELMAEQAVAAVGIAAAGFVSRDQSTVRYAPNIDWRNEPIRNWLEPLAEVPVIVENDANAAGWAEYRFGAGRGSDHMVMLTIGTGVGGAIVSEGRLLRGASGAAAELGHIRLVPDGLPCGCGQRGCLEQYASGRSLLRRANEIADRGANALAEARTRDGELNADNVGALLRAGEPLAVSALEDLGEQLGVGCASLTAVLDPERFVIGGGLAVAGEVLAEPIRRGLASHLPAAEGHGPEVVIAQLGNDAGIIGAADIARLYAANEGSLPVG